MPYNPLAKWEKVDLGGGRYTMRDPATGRMATNADFWGTRMLPSAMGGKGGPNAAFLAQPFVTQNDSSNWVDSIKDVGGAALTGWGTGLAVGAGGALALEGGAALAAEGGAAGAGATAMPAAVADTSVLAAPAAAAGGVAAGATLMPPAVVDTAALTGSAAAAGTGAAAVGTQEATGAATEPGAPATGPQMPPAQPEMGTGGAATSKSVLSTVKDLAPVVSAGASILGAGAALSAGSPDMGQLDAPTAPDLPVEADVQKQNAIDPDLTAIRRKNALLFGLDSPSNTDLTRGNADTGNLGRVTLLGGTSRLG